MERQKSLFLPIAEPPREKAASAARKTVSRYLYVIILLIVVSVHPSSYRLQSLFQIPRKVAPCSFPISSPLFIVPSVDGHIVAIWRINPNLKLPPLGANYIHRPNLLILIQCVEDQPVLRHPRRNNSVNCRVVDHWNGMFSPNCTG